MKIQRIIAILAFTYSASFANSSHTLDAQAPLIFKDSIGRFSSNEVSLTNLANTAYTCSIQDGDNASISSVSPGDGIEVVHQEPQLLKFLANQGAELSVLLSGPFARRCDFTMTCAPDNADLEVHDILDANAQTFEKVVGDGFIYTEDSSNESDVFDGANAQRNGDLLIDVASLSAQGEVIRVSNGQFRAVVRGLNPQSGYHLNLRGPSHIRVESIESNQLPHNALVLDKKNNAVNILSYAQAGAESYEIVLTIDNNNLNAGQATRLTVTGDKISTEVHNSLKSLEFLGREAGYKLRERYVLPEENGEKRAYRTTILRTDHTGMAIQVLIPEVIEVGKPVELKLIARGSKGMGWYRDAEIASGGVGYWTFERNRESILKQLSAIQQELKAANPEMTGFTLTISGHSLGGADGQNLAIAIIEQLAFNNDTDGASTYFANHREKNANRLLGAEFPLEFKSIHLSDQNPANVPASQHKLGNEALEVLRDKIVNTKEFSLSVSPFKVDNDSVQKTGYAHAFSDVDPDLAYVRVVKKKKPRGFWRFLTAPYEYIVESHRSKYFREQDPTLSNSDIVCVDNTTEAGRKEVQRTLENTSWWIRYNPLVTAFSYISTIGVSSTYSEEKAQAIYDDRMARMERA